MGSRHVGCLIVMVVLLLEGKGATAETYTVGADLGWTTPPLRSSIVYTTWAHQHIFEIDDQIMFNWTGSHNVAEVSNTDYESCTKTSPIGTILTSSPANFTLSNTTHYFICTINNHCEDGQKVTIQIGDQSWNSAPSLTPTTLTAALALLSTVAISFFTY